MAETKVLKKTHPLSELDARMDPAVLEKARKMAEQESLNIRLGMGLEIAAYPRNSTEKEILLRV
jgi:hypothetical protein